MHRKRIPSAKYSAKHVVLGGAVRETRARRGFSQEELGQRANLHRNYVGAIERGEINPTFVTLLRLAHGLGVALSTLVQLYEVRCDEATR